MSDIFQSQLHVTAWPGVPLPLPVTYRVESKLTDEGVIVPCPRGHYGRDWHEDPVPLKGETYLRLASVDLDDPEAIYAFVAEYGPLGGWEAQITFMQEAPFAIAQVYQGQLDSEIEHEKKTHALREEQTTPSPDSDWPSYALRFHYTETLDEFRFAARCLRDLTSAWRMFKDGTPASGVHWVSPQHSDPELLSEDAFPLLLLTRMLPNCFLRPFSPHLTLNWEPPLPAGPLTNFPPRQGGTSVDPLRRPTSGGRLYSICALELFNHIVENADYLICGNEKCQQKNFVHQQGAKKNWHRSSGVLYCSHACAHAKAQREYRLRRLTRER